MGNKLQACQIISTPNELVSFGRAFGLAQPLFNFIDVGAGKERADHKVRETLRLFVPNAQCKHVFFGPCHDNGYLSVLEPYRGDANFASKITLIETTPAEFGFTQLGLKRISIPQAFRDKPLPTKPAMSTQASYQMPPALRPSSSVSRTASMDPSITAFSPPPVSSSPTPAQAASNNSWATVGKVGGGSKSFDISTTKMPKKRYVMLNAYDERLDPDLPKPDGKAYERFVHTTETEGRNFCNNYHLSGKCDAREYCDYIHGPKLTPGEQLVLRHKARSIMCGSRYACKAVDCYLRHHCKYGSTCSSPKCRFAETHNQDMVSLPSTSICKSQSKQMCRC